MNSQTKVFIIFLILIAFCIGIGIVVYPKNDSVAIQSALILSPTPILTPTSSPEPFIASYIPYTNDKFNFSLSIPSEWKVQDYSTFYNNGSSLIAFSPYSLPCETCTYLHEGYLSIRIFDEKSEPDLFSAYLQKIKTASKNPKIKRVVLDNKQGLLSGNMITVENQGWVYEFSLDKDEGNATIEDSKIFQKIVSSVKFTNLAF